MSFKRLVRFVDENGQTLYGDFGDIVPSADVTGSMVKVLDGNLETGWRPAGRQATITKLLSPLPSPGIVLCIAMNYKDHVEGEGKHKVPKYPSLFCKPPDALTGPYDTISIHPETQSMLDYEGELTVVISKDAKNVQEDEALDYVLGYTSSNDISARDWQMPEEISGWQFAYAKSFDGFAPVGPCLTSTALIPDPQQLKYTTKVNGQVRQESSTKNMVFPVKQIIAHLSRGTTIRKGTFIMTGTAAGVGLFIKPEGSGFVKDGDVVEVEFEGIGSIRNKHTFE